MLMISTKATNAALEALSSASYAARLKALRLKIAALEAAKEQAERVAKLAKAELETARSQEDIERRGFEWACEAEHGLVPKPSFR